MSLCSATVHGLCVWVCALCLAPSPVYALGFDYAGFVEIDWTRTSLRDAGQRTLTTEPSISTLEFDLSVLFTPQWSMNLVALAEDIGVTDSADYIPYPDMTDKRPDRLHIDEFTLDYSTVEFEAAVGRMTLPFGQFQTGLLSDTQALVLGEVSTEAGARALYRRNEVYLGGAVFDGNLRSVAPDQTGYIAFAGWETEQLLLQLGYLSAQYASEDAPALIDLGLIYSAGPWIITTEFTGALQAQAGQRPRALQVELGYQFNPQWNMGVRHQQTWRFPVLSGGNGDYKEWAVGLNRALTEQVVVGLEQGVATEGGSRQQTTLLRFIYEF